MNSTVKNEKVILPKKRPKVHFPTYHKRKGYDVVVLMLGIKQKCKEWQTENEQESDPNTIAKEQIHKSQQFYHS
mgnify:CR=1 FL=1